MEEKTLQEKRGFEGSISMGDEKLQVHCACTNNYSKQLGKKKTQPLDVRVITEAHAHCGICGCMPYVILPKGRAFALYNAWK